MKKKKLFLICLAIFIVLLLLMVKLAFSADDWVTPTAIHSDCGHTGDSVSSRLIDDDLGTYWQHDGTEDHWVIFDMGETYTVKQVRCYHVQYVHWVEVGEVYVSDDVENWGDSLGASTANWYTGVTGWEEIDITDKDGRYIKIVGNAQDRMGFYEFDIYGSTAGAPPAPGAAQPMNLILE